MKQIRNVHNLYTQHHSRCFGYIGEQDRGCYVFMALEANSGDGHCETAYAKGPLKSSLDTSKKGIFYPYSKRVLREITFKVR